MEKKVYIAMATDFVNSAHLNIIEEGAKLGNVIIGVLSDAAVATYKRVPLIDFETRSKIFSSMRNVSQVVCQDSLEYDKVLREIKPDYVIHGDDWRTGIQSKIREGVIEVLKEWGGELIEIPYNKDLMNEDIEKQLTNYTSTPDVRRAKLRNMLKLKPYVRVMEASNGLSGLIVENAIFADKEKGVVREYDAMWISSLCDSTFKGKPDIELVDLTSRINTINEIIEVTSKPIILDGDTGGKVEHFSYNVKTLERLGVSAIIIEDKTGLKQNSLYGTDAKQVLEEPHKFAEKIRAGKNAQNTRDFMIFARLESLIAGYGVEDALDRAKIYIEEGHADGVMIHSKQKDGEEIKEFLIKFRQIYADIPVILVPTTYNHITEDELHDMGANIIIHANHLLRSAYPAMLKTATKILETGRSKDVDELCLPIKEVLSLIPGGKK